MVSSQEVISVSQGQSQNFKLSPDSMDVPSKADTITQEPFVQRVPPGAFPEAIRTKKEFHAARISAASQSRSAIALID